LIDGAMSDATLAILPTQYQANTFPERWRHKIKVLHEGVTQELLDLPRIKELQIDNTIALREGVPVVTFISRNLEPMRGFPEFMRSLPELLDLNNEVQIVIVGGNEVSYSSAPADGRNWKDIFVEELAEKINLARIHMLGRIPYTELTKLYRRSNLHIYLSNPFVLSWSVIEVMACGTPVLARDNAMMQDLVKSSENGYLWNDKDLTLGRAMADLLSQPRKLEEMGERGKEFIGEYYGQKIAAEKLETLLIHLCKIY